MKLLTCSHPLCAVTDAKKHTTDAKKHMTDAKKHQRHDATHYGSKRNRTKTTRQWSRLVSIESLQNIKQINSYENIKRISYGYICLTDTVKNIIYLAMARLFRV